MGKMKECYKVLLLIVIESLFIGGSYYYLMQTTWPTFGHDAVVVIIGMLIGIIITNILLVIPVDFVMKTVGRWVLLSFVFLIVLMWTAMIGSVPYNLQTLLVISSSASFSLIGMKWMLEKMFTDSTEENDLKVISKLSKIELKRRKE